jgi:Tfp pilus assembly protein PilP
MKRTRRRKKMQRKSSFFIILLTILVIFFSGCGSDTPKPIKIHIPIKVKKKKGMLKDTLKKSDNSSMKKKFQFSLNNFSRDPFKPFFKAEEVPAEDNISEEIIVTPLTKYKLSQFKLAAIITGKKKKPIAMVETEDNLGLFFQVGDYLGKELYKVVAIKSDRIILEKKEKDFFNRIKIKRKELILETEGE